MFVKSMKFSPPNLPPGLYAFHWSFYLKQFASVKGQIELKPMTNNMSIVFEAQDFLQSIDFPLSLDRARISFYVFHRALEY